MVFSHWTVAILNRHVLNDWLVVLLVVALSVEEVRVVVGDKIGVSKLIHHWHHWSLKRLDVVDDKHPVVGRYRVFI